MKTLNLVVAIIYSLFLGLLVIDGIFSNDKEMVLGCVFISVPVIVNWITYKNLKE